MIPVKFKQQNRTLVLEGCNDLPVFSDGVHCISCWQLSDEEIKELITTRKLYIGVVSGDTQPPMLAQVSPPFNEEKKPSLICPNTKKECDMRTVFCKTCSMYKP